MPAMEDTHPDVRFTYAGVFLVSLAALLLQIALTRIFSFTLWYHFAYVTISVALLGYGAAGSVVALVREPERGSGPRLAALALCCGVSTVLGLVVFATVPFHPFEAMNAWLGRGVRSIPRAPLVYTLVFYAAVSLPFFFAGACMAVALRANAHDVSRLYLCDLVGAGVGCLVVVSVIAAATTPGAVVVAAVTASLAGVMFTLAARPRRLGRPIAGVVAVAMLGAVAVAKVEFSPSPEKFQAITLRDTAHTRAFPHRWSAIFRTDSYGWLDENQSRNKSYGGWGVSPYWREAARTRAPKVRLIAHDGDAGAVIYNFDGDLSKLELFDHLVLKVPYLLLDRPNVLVIGVGGGTDIVNAVKNHPRHVTGVELDPSTVDLVRVEHVEFAGHLYERPDVTVVVGEGRSALRHSPQRYDLIQMSGVDTLAALSTGAYVLSESYLYTTEAMQEMLAHLEPDGVLSIVIGDFSLATDPLPRHGMRQLSLFLDALDRLGIADPSRHIVVVASPDRIAQVVMLLRPKAFAADEVGRIREFAVSEGFEPLALPGTILDTPHSRYVRAPRAERAALLADWPLLLTATTDDTPFFFNFYRWRDVWRRLHEIDVGHSFATGQIVLAAILVFSVVSAALCIVLPLWMLDRRGLRARGSAGFIVFFLGIGLGFMFLEISLVQRFVLFVGYPTYSLTVVLFALLVWSGLGSALTARMTRPPEARFVPLLFAVALLGLLYPIALPALFGAFLGRPFALRVAVTILVLAPLGLPLGMFFPSGIQIARRVDASFVPWAWAINACASVVATVLAVMLAMAYGFQVVTLAALGLYALAVLGMRASASSSAT